MKRTGTDLFPGPVNYVENDYKNFVNEIYEEKPLTKHKELEPFREDIKLLFQKYDIKYLIELDEYNTPDSWLYAIDEAVFIATHLNGRELSKKTLDYMENHCQSAYVLTKSLLVIYCPEEMAKNLSEYLWWTKDVVDCCSLYLWKKNEVEKVDVGNSFLNELYNYQYGLYLYDEHQWFEKISRHGRFVALIAAYLHLHNMFSADLFSDFIENMEQYFNELTMDEKGKKYTLDSIEHIWEGDLPTKHPIYKKMFNNLDKVFAKQKELIK